jgi:hypothetical protein
MPYREGSLPPPAAGFAPPAADFAAPWSRSEDRSAADGLGRQVQAECQYHDGGNKRRVPGEATES